MSSARIAAASPDAILKLLDRIAELEAKLAALETLIDKDQSEWTEFEPWAEYVSMDIEKDEQGYYTSITTDMALQAWEMAKK